MRLAKMYVRRNRQVGDLRMPSQVSDSYQLSLYIQFIYSVMYYC